eukprot:m51a1_g7857 hypothetical protein (324) ;mRNA; r:249010-250341
MYVVVADGCLCSDMHYDFGELGAEGAMTDVVQQNVLDAERPDLVVITGDAMSGTAMHNYTQARIAWDRTTAVLRQNNYKWALTFGNHDDDGPMGKQELARLDMARAGSYTMRGPQEVPGVTNYYLPLYAGEHAHPGESPVALLWLLDVQGFNCEGVRGPGCVTRGQVQWFLNTSRLLTAQYGLEKPLFSVMFFHIPLPEHAAVWESDECWGSRDEPVSCPRVNTGMYEAAYSQGVRAIFVGHNHKNDYCGAFRGRRSLWLCYGRKTGYGYYNPTFPMLHGSRVIELKLGANGAVSWNSWVRTAWKTTPSLEKHSPQGGSHAAP